MTATLSASNTIQINRPDRLAIRLSELREERDRTLAEVIPGSLGDAADRASNVDAEVRLAMLDQRITALELELDAARRGGQHADDGVVSEGDSVTVDLGDGPETFLIGAVEAAAGGVEVITPRSPLGQALLGARAGETVRYQTAARRTLEARIVAID